MIVQCPNCGKPVVVNGLGRKKLNISVKNVCDALQHSSTVKAAAAELGCSPGYLYKVVNKPRELLRK